MSVVEHLTKITSALDELQVPHLVMGGHAVRYYGFRRETTDHDLHIPADIGHNLSDLLRRTSLFVFTPLIEAPTWRGDDDFKRYVVGVLPDGKEEFLEFWIHNHLLDDFENLYGRREEGIYGEKKISFLSLPDLIRSKETERENDWQDISFLEEILDQRNFSNAKNETDIISALSTMKSVRGLEIAVNNGFLTNPSNVESAIKSASNSITQAFLLPFIPNIESELPLNEILPAPFRKHLTRTEPCGSRHLALVEAVRLRYKRAMQNLDRLDKDEHRKRRQL
ncbi:MAG: hypothetical protein MSG64_00685 [Pyrinomonadaceae bacterium MAG19_C2-C3]|nr:hypothetical protein [Pyrinomonadaceae bacterium MAG19_C2-C3]